MNFKNSVNSRLKKVITGLACFATLVCVILGSNSIFAVDPNEGQELTVTTTYDADKSQEVPISVEADKEVFYFNSNIDPGDSLNASIKFVNASEKYPVNVTIAEIKNLLSDDRNALEFLGQLDLTISTDDGLIIYQGKHGKTTTPVVGSMEIQPGKDLILHIQVDFPKDADNTFQASEMSVRYIFESRLDISNTDWPDEPPSFPERVQTGLQEGDPATWGMVILAVAAIVLIIVLIIFFIKKKKKDDDKNEDETTKPVEDNNKASK